MLADIESGIARLIGGMVRADMPTKVAIRLLMVTVPLLPSYSR